MKHYWDRDYSAAARKAAVKTGAAMPGGRFPIKSSGDVVNAVRDWNRIGQPADVKAHIIKRARELDALSSLPDTWGIKDAMTDCPNCDGTGKVKGKVCKTCDGDGEVMQDGSTCDNCDGTGTDPETGEDCTECNGDGVLKDANDGKPLQMFDSVVLDGIHRTKDGYLAAFARSARTGIQIYRGYEVGRPDMKEVRVYRPSEEVFKKDAVKSFAHRPVTLNHPREAVNSRNWSKYARGHTGDEVMKDGEFLRVPLVMMDAGLIESVESGKTKELSWGYTADMKFRDGIVPEGEPNAGEKYDAVQTAIRANHLAVVSNARGGDKLRVGDHKQKENKSMKLTVDGVNVEIDDERDGQVIQRQFKKDADTITDLTAKLSASTAEIKTVKDSTEKALADQKKLLDEATGKIAALEKSVADSKITPAKLNDMVKERAEVVAKAAKFVGKDYKPEDKDTATIKKDAVLAHLGDAAKSFNDDAISAAFVTMTKDLKVVTPSGSGTLADAIRLQSTSVETTDAKAERQKAYNDMVERNSNAWKGTKSDKSVAQA